MSTHVLLFVVVAAVVIAAVAIPQIALALWTASRRDAGPVVIASTEIDSFGTREFERVVAEIFCDKGYEVEVVREIEPGCVDLVLARDSSRMVVRAKRHRGTLGPEVVKQMLRLKGQYFADEAVMLTTATFTSDAFRIANANAVLLRDKIWLRRELEDRERQLAAAVV